MTEKKQEYVFNTVGLSNICYTYPMRPLGWKSPNQVLSSFFMEEVQQMFDNPTKINKINSRIDGKKHIKLV